MKKTWFRIKGEYFSYSRSDRNAVLILSTLILLVLFANKLIDYLPKEAPEDFTEMKELIAEWEREKDEAEKRSEGSWFTFDPNTISVQELESLDLPGNIKKNLVSYRKAGGHFKVRDDFRKIYGMNDSLFAIAEAYMKIAEDKQYRTTVAAKEETIELHPFDPNKASLNELKDLGFSEFQANNLIRYRNSGGSLTQKADLLRIYGIDSVLFKRVEAYLLIPLEINPATPKPEVPIVPIDLNTADSASLMALSGIGPAYASRIIKYRELLGGYYSKEQVMEVYNFPEETYENISPHIYADSLAIAKIRINFSEYPELIRHPYLNREQVKQLLERRRTKGSFKNISELSVLQSFDSETLRKIAPYITCN